MSSSKKFLVIEQGPDGRPEIVMERYGKFTKEEAGYGPSKEPRRHRCGICEYHLHIPGTDRMECGIVEGEIKDTDGCKFFDINLIAAVMHPRPSAK